MKMKDETYARLKRTVSPFMKGDTERERWDALWASGLNPSELYNEGLNDNHIDTALRRIQRFVRRSRAT